VRIGPDAAVHLEGASALIVGTVDADGVPHANRAWSALVSEDRASLRLVLDGGDTVGLANLEATGRIAVTGASVRTLRSVQVKGRARGPARPPTALEHAMRERHTELFLTDVEQTDNVPRAVLDRFVPVDFVVVDVEVEELYDQSPGPEAGRELAPEPP